MGTHLRVLSESYPMNTNMTGFRGFSKIFASMCFEQEYLSQKVPYVSDHVERSRCKWVNILGNNILFFFLLKTKK